MHAYIYAFSKAIASIQESDGNMDNLIRHSFHFIQVYDATLGCQLPHDRLFAS